MLTNGKNLFKILVIAAMVIGPALLGRAQQGKAQKSDEDVCANEAKSGFRGEVMVWLTVDDRCGLLTQKERHEVETALKYEVETCGVTEEELKKKREDDRTKLPCEKWQTHFYTLREMHGLSGECDSACKKWLHGD